jgi:hypothetical protein
MKKAILLILSGFLILQGYASTPQKDQDKIVLSGHIRDKQNGEELIGANIYIDGKPIGTSTNVYGYYSLSLEKGKYTVVFSYIGYHTKSKTLTLNENKTVNVELISKDQQIEEIVVTAEKPDENITRDQMSFEKLEMKQVKKMPSFMGEADIVKSVQLLPGVQSLSEGSSGYSVRGGSQDQNLVLLDEATVYNISHMLGFFSVFNNDAIQNAELYKGDIPAKYGTRLSSVLDIRMKNGNSKEFTATGGVGSISSRLTLEGPIIEDRSSFIVSGRRTYFDMFFPLLPEDQIQGNKLYFYDLNTKINHRINENNRIYLSGYFGRDQFKNQFSDFGYGNQTATFRWNHLFSKKLFSNTTILYSNYNYHLGTPDDVAWGMTWDSKLIDYSAKLDFTYYANPNNTLTFGGSAAYHTYNPGEIKGSGEESMFNTFQIPKSHALEYGVYLSNNQNLLNNRLSLKYGLRLSMFQNIGTGTLYSYNGNYEVTDTTKYNSGDVYNTYIGLEPRLGIKYKINGRSSVKASYSRTRQHVQMAQNSRAGTPLDIWFPATPNVEPQVSDQYALGYFRNFWDNKLETSVETYYKKMKNTIDFKDHAWLLMNPHMEGELRFGKARAYGVELMAKIKRKDIHGWISYTYSHSERKIGNIADGNYYNAPYDRPHDISVVLSYDFNDRMTLSSNWIYSSGQPVTFPTGRHEADGLVVPVYSDRNAYRLPDYHRLDLSFTIRSKKKPDKKWQGEWNFSVYNAYGRKNTWAINFVQDEHNPNETYAEKTYLFSVIPSVTYNFKF